MTAVERWADLGFPVRYLDFGGPPDGPIVVAVHGLGGSAAVIAAHACPCPVVSDGPYRRADVL